MTVMVNGIINLRKEAGMTSHDAVFKLRKILQEKKIGHGGTLDPDVTGVLPIAVGKATRIIEYMTDSGKVYEGQIVLGFATTTEDASGDIIAKTPVPNSLTEKEIDEAMSHFEGDITQIPPMYSAVKVKGKKLYEYARLGEDVERPERQVTIKSFLRTTPLVREGDTVSFHFKVSCGKGTYVRTLAVDLGKHLGLASHMSQLKRTTSAGLQLEEAYSLEEISNKCEQNDLSFLLPIEYGLTNLGSVELSADEVKEVTFGRFITIKAQEEIVAGFHQGKVVAILEKRGEYYKPKKVLIS